MKTPNSRPAPRALVLALSLALSLGAAAPTAQAYSVANGRIYNDAGAEIRLFGVNWFGMETPDLAPHGLWARNYVSMISQMKSLGFNAVRLPFCPNTLRGARVSAVDYSLNPDLAGLNSLQLMDRIVQELDRQGLYVVLDHHRPDCNAISPLWYTSSYPESQWIADLQFVADRYKNVTRFIGIDLKNEPHGAATWGTGNSATDWNRAAERAASAVLARNARLLIFVEGIEYNPTCSGSEGRWWGGNLAPAACTPLAIAANRRVYSPHVYGPDVFVQSYFNAANFPANMPPIWDSHFGFLRDAGEAVIPGEFGGRYGHGGDPRDRVWQDALVDYFIRKGVTSFFYWSWNPNSGDTGGILQDDWNTPWSDKVALLQRLMTPVASGPRIVAGTTALTVPEAGSARFSVRLSAAPAANVSVTVQRLAGGDADLSVTGSALLNFGPGNWNVPQTVTLAAAADSDAISSSARFSLSGVGLQGATIVATEADDETASTVNCRVLIDTRNDWGNGHVGQVTFSNTGSQPINGWTVRWSSSSDFTLASQWGGQFSLSGRTMQVSPLAWNSTIASGSSAQFGWVAQYSGAKPLLSQVSVDGRQCAVEVRQ